MNYIETYLIIYIVYGVFSLVILSADNYSYFKYKSLNSLNKLNASVFLTMTPLAIFCTIFLATIGA